jgi:hypothetical protein
MPNCARRAAYWVVDLGSTNGLEVNGKQRARLRDGTRSRWGRLRSCSGALPTEPPAIETDETLLILKIAFLVLLTDSSSWSSLRDERDGAGAPAESIVPGAAEAAQLRAEHGLARRNCSC